MFLTKETVIHIPFKHTVPLQNVLQSQYSITQTTLNCTKQQQKQEKIYHKFTITLNIFALTINQ